MEDRAKRLKELNEFFVEKGWDKDMARLDNELRRGVRSFLAECREKKVPWIHAYTMISSVCAEMAADVAALKPTDGMRKHVKQVLNDLVDESFDKAKSRFLNKASGGAAKEMQ